jgi:hypothetical protein
LAFIPQACSFDNLNIGGYLGKQFNGAIVLDFELYTILGDLEIKPALSVLEFDFQIDSYF